MVPYQQVGSLEGGAVQVFKAPIPRACEARCGGIDAADYPSYGVADDGEQHRLAKFVQSQNGVDGRKHPTVQEQLLAHQVHLLGLFISCRHPGLFLPEVVVLVIHAESANGRPPARCALLDFHRRRHLQREGGAPLPHDCRSHTRDSVFLVGQASRSSRYVFALWPITRYMIVLMLAILLRDCSSRELSVALY